MGAHGHGAGQEGKRTVRILHTSDWHAGKAWKGQHRLDELEAVLDDLAAAVERERIDLVLMTGDVFDTSSPSAEAERLVFRFFRRVGRMRVPSLVIAGNHDSPARVDAWAQLAELAHVTAAGVARRHDAGGCVTVETSGGELAVVGMVPFVGPSYFLAAEDIGSDPDGVSSRYARCFARLVADVSLGFRPDAVNVLMAHTHLRGARVGTSERRVHVAEEWAADPAILPASAQYVALGHIHRHQQIEAAAVPTWFAGAPLQLDFGEEGERKAYLIVEAAAGGPAHVESRDHVGGRPLRTHAISAAQLRRGPHACPAPDLTDRPHLRVVVDCAEGDVDPDVNRRVREMWPGVVSVDVRRDVPSGDAAITRPAAPDPGRGVTMTPRELYALFRRQHEAPVDEATLTAFDALYHEALESEGGT